MLNIDLVNKIGSVNNGWDEYKINGTYTTDTDITPVDLNLPKSLKNILLVYTGKEENDKVPRPPKNAFNLSKLIIDVTLQDDSLQTFTINTTWYDNFWGFNIQSYCVPLAYPLVVKNIKITVTCPGESVTLKNVYFTLVYADDEFNPPSPSPSPLNLVSSLQMSKI